MTMCNPANKEEIKACVDAGVDLFVIGPRSIEELRSVAPTHFTGVGTPWAQLDSHEDIMRHAFNAMRKVPICTTHLDPMM